MNRAEAAAGWELFPDPVEQEEVQMVEMEHLKAAEIALERAEETYREALLSPEWTKENGWVARMAVRQAYRLWYDRAESMILLTDAVKALGRDGPYGEPE